jgi:PIN domain nuclease of toxin-antitoxin system
MARDVIALDTHVLLWWALDPEQLSAAAASALSAMEQRGGLASAISIWELAIKIKRGKLELPLPVEEFVRRVKRSGIIELVAVDTELWLRSVSLDWAHADPADRVIVATAESRGVPLVTKDAAIRTYSKLECIW